MEERLKNYLQKLEKLKQQSDCGQNSISDEERKRLLDDLLVQISFFQHERLIHLIVTVLFALMTTITLLGILAVFQPLLLALMLLLLILLVPYIRHYYILENGVQKLYGYYDWLSDAPFTQTYPRSDHHGH